MCRSADRPVGPTSGLTPRSWLISSTGRRLALGLRLGGAAPCAAVDIQSEDRFQSFTQVTTDAVCRIVGDAADVLGA